MSLADRTLTVAQQGPRCFYERIMGQLDEDDRATLQGWLDDPQVPSSAITRALREDGWQLGPTTTARHRRGDCRCDR